MPRFSHALAFVSSVGFALVVSTAVASVPAEAQTGIDSITVRTRLLSDHAHWFPDGSVVVSSNITGNWQVWRVNPNGHYLRLSHNAGQDDWPTVSPDGALVAFASTRNGQEDIWLVPGVGGEERNLTNHPAHDIHPTWSPDGSRILFNSNREDSTRFALYSMRVDGTDMRGLTDLSASRTAAWWSPDSEYIAFVKWMGENEDQPDVHVMRADGTEEHNISNHPGFDGWPTWSPDGRHIVFASNRLGRFQIYIVEPNGSNLRRLIESEYNDRRAFFSPHGSRLSFDRETPEGRNILIANLSGQR